MAIESASERPARRPNQIVLALPTYEQGSARAFEHRVTEMTHRHGVIYREHPNLRRYMTRHSIGAGAALIQLKPFLQANPVLLEDLSGEHAQHPDEISMLIAPDYPVVIAQQGKQASVLIPTLGCTLSAIRDISNSLSKRVDGEYLIVHSDDGLMERAWTTAEQEENRFLDYSSRTMDPRDYVALAARGAFFNEVFHLPLQKLG